MLKIYRSSAGSGKTFTLVKEYLRICILSKDSSKYRHILAITFTNKAANEMKERILHALDDFANGAYKEVQLLEILLHETGATKEEVVELAKQMLHKILQDYSSFAISTIDSFVQKLIRSFTYELNIPHNFEVHIDNEEQLDIIVQNLMDEINDDKDNELAKSLIQLAEENIDDGKTWNIENVIREFAKSMRTEDSLPYLIKLTDIDFEEVKATEKRLREYQRTYENKLNELGLKGEELIEKAGLTIDNFAYNKSGVAGHFSKLVEFPSKDATPSARTITAIEQDKWTTKKEDENIITLVDSIKDDLKNLLLESFEIQSKEEPNYTLATLFLKNIYLYKIIDGINKAILKMKEEENILPINEFQTLISSIVSKQDAPIIFERLGEKYDCILIDEFQDTSLLQFRNLLPLIENSQYKDEVSLIVGDAKQSIYRFKGGEAEQLVTLPAIFGSHENEILLEREIAINNYPTEELVLSKNFRSKKNIIEFNNAFYEKMKSIDPAIQKIYADHEQEFDEKKEGGFVSIESILNNEEDNETPKLERIVSIIQECEAKGYTTGDIAILVSKNRRGADIASFLLNEGYEVESNESLFYTASREASLLVGCLRYIHDADAKLTRYELIKNIGILEDSDFENLYKIVNYPIHLFDEIISTKTSEPFNSNELRLLDLESLAYTLSKVFCIDYTNIFISSFLDIIADYCARNNNNLGEFLKWWEVEQTKKSIQNSAKPNAIKIMTLHKSKGLQFPVVIIPDLDEKIKNRNGYVWIENDEFIGLSPILVNLQKDLLKTRHSELFEIETQKSIIDYLNVLYVGTTRAEDRLYLLYDIEKALKSKQEFSNIYHFLSHYLDEKSEQERVEIGDKNTSKTYKKTNPAQHKYLILQSDVATIELLPTLKGEFTKTYNEEAEYGTLLHSFLDNLAKTNLAYTFQKLEQLSLDNTLKQQLKVDIEFVHSNPTLSKYYSEGYQLLAEVSVLDKENKIQKPDLVAIQKNTKNVVIIDFKTGKIEAKHKLQIQHYASLLSQSGYMIEELIIVYTQTKEIVKL